MYYNSRKLSVCGVLLDSVHVFVHVVLLVAHYQFGVVFPSDVELQNIK